MTKMEATILLLFMAGFCFVEKVAGFNRLSRFPTYRATPLKDGYSYKTLYFDQQVDHFGFYNQDTYKQRYLVADQYWNKNSGPIFFYTGNEGDITLFCNNTGFMWDIAPEFSAMIIFAEHRYYGVSMPYGAESYKDFSKLNYLTSEQALADFATLIEYIKSTTPGASHSRVVAFGGSYGGMLSAWLRMKYPSIVVGALAASASIWQFHNLTPCQKFDEIVTKTFATYSSNCVNNIRKVYSTIDSLVKSGEENSLKYLTSTFGLCKPLKANEVDTLEEWLEGIWINLAMINYPYPANFLEPLPAWPVKGACDPLKNVLNGKELIQGVANSVKFYFNSTGNVKCLNISEQDTGNPNETKGWDYQFCTEMVFPMCSDNTTIFRPSTWNYTALSESCYKRFKLRPREDWINTNYWGKSLSTASNIIFSNGQFDPWMSGGVTKSQSDSVIAIYIKYGAHHLDLRSANPLDTESVRATRIQEKNIIRGWLYDKY